MKVMYFRFLILSAIVHVVCITVTMAQLRQIVNIPWGTEKDYVGATIYKSNGGGMPLPQHLTQIIEAGRIFVQICTAFLRWMGKCVFNSSPHNHNILPSD
jgi:hypothetical protein